MSIALKVRLSLTDRFRYAVLKLRHDIAQSDSRRAAEACYVTAQRAYYLGVTARNSRAYMCASERAQFAKEHSERARKQAYYMERILDANVLAANRTGKMPRPAIR